MRMTSGLPHWLPEWEGAEAFALNNDMEQVRSAARDLVDYVLSPDLEVLDSLPADVESNLVAPLGALARVLDGSQDATELVVASRLVRHAVGEHLDECTREFVDRVRRLPE
jgi:hypothetical protein